MILCVFLFGVKGLGPLFGPLERGAWLGQESSGFGASSCGLLARLSRLRTSGPKYRFCKVSFKGIHNNDKKGTK